MWKRLDKWQGNLSTGMTKDKYLDLCHQMGEDPREDKCPPDLGDFPYILQQAIETFNKLGDRVYPDIGYVGKDFTTIDLYIDIAKITERDLFLEALVRLDAYMIKKSNEDLKKARETAKRKANGK